jgi:hypothetical protein
MGWQHLQECFFMCGKCTGPYSTNVGIAHQSPVGSCAALLAEGVCKQQRAVGRGSWLQSELTRWSDLLEALNLMCNEELLLEAKEQHSLALHAVSHPGLTRWPLHLSRFRYLRLLAPQVHIIITSTVGVAG